MVLKVSIAKFLIAGLCIALPCVGAHAAQKSVRYTCAADKNLTVERDETAARVSLDGRSYYLQRKRSSIGDKYLSTDAALIIDGPSVVFVADRDLDLGTCVQQVPIALNESPDKPSR